MLVIGKDSYRELKMEQRKIEEYFVIQPICGLKKKKQFKNNSNNFTI